MHEVSATPLPQLIAVPPDAFPHQHQLQDQTQGGKVVIGVRPGEACNSIDGSNTVGWVRDKILGINGHTKYRDEVVAILTLISSELVARRYQRHSADCC